MKALRLPPTPSIVSAICARGAALRSLKEHVLDEVRDAALFRGSRPPSRRRPRRRPSPSGRAGIVSVRTRRPLGSVVFLYIVLPAALKALARPLLVPEDAVARSVEPRAAATPHASPRRAVKLKTVRDVGLARSPLTITPLRDADRHARPKIDLLHRGSGREGSFDDRRRLPPTNSLARHRFGET